MMSMFSLSTNAIILHIYNKSRYAHTIKLYIWSPHVQTKTHS